MQPLLTEKTEKSTALLLIDLQMAFALRDAGGEPRSTPEAEANIQKLMSAFRANALHTVHIHHHSTEADSAFRPENPGVKVQPFATPLDNELVYVKHVNSAFIGTTLEADLRAQGVSQLILCGATANHCVETSTRMAGNLGFDAFYVSDAVWAYGSVGPDGQAHTPEDVLSMSLSNLNGEFAEVISTAALLEKLGL